MDAMADQPTSVVNRPRPLESLVASAARLKSTNISKFGRSKDSSWQDESTDLYRAVGEQRFLGSTLGNRIGQVRLFVGRLPEDPLDDPDPIVRPDPLDTAEQARDTTATEPLSTEDEQALATWEAFASNPVHVSQIMTRAGINLFSTGDGWLVGVPKDLLNASPVDQSGTLVPAPRQVDRTQVQGPSDPNAVIPGGMRLEDLVWRFLSVKECQIDPSSKKVTLHIKEGDSAKDKLEVSPDQVFMVRIWRPDPFEWWEADSPTRSSLGVLRELVGLSMHIDAQIDSRLIGAGMLLIPQEAADAVKAQLPNAETDDQTDPFSASLMAVMMAAIGDRASAAAKVPIMPVVPGDTIEKFRYISFSAPLDAEARPLREEAIRRLALGQDCPPELLLGVGNMNHWGAWLVQEDTVTTHIEPPAALICDAMTTQFLWPILIENGMPEELAKRYVVWYSVDHMISRPNNFADAATIYGEGELSGDALRRAGGFSPEDAPENQDPAIALVVEMLKQAPSLAQTPGIPVLVEQIRAVMNDGEAPAAQTIGPSVPSDGPPGASEDSGGAQGPPDPESGSETPPEGSDGPPGLAASGLRQDGWLVSTDDDPSYNPWGEPEPADV